MEPNKTRCSEPPNKFRLLSMLDDAAMRKQSHMVGVMWAGSGLVLLPLSGFVGWLYAGLKGGLIGVMAAVFASSFLGAFVALGQIVPPTPFSRAMAEVPKLRSIIRWSRNYVWGCLFLLTCLKILHPAWASAVISALHMPIWLAAPSTGFVRHVNRKTGWSDTAEFSQPFLLTGLGLLCLYIFVGFGARSNRLPEP